MKVKKERPLGIKILTILYSCGSVFMLLVGIMALASSYYLANYPAEVESAFSAEELAQLGSVAALVPFFIMFGIFCILIAVLDIFLGLGFWKGQKWARILTLILSALGIVYGIIGIILSITDSYTIFLNLFSIAIDGVLIWYLMKKNVILYFTQKKD
ncbi:hypothetical protein EXS74_02495 [Candidatus Woesearchaeota archaeon]|nr:hypothetical protein [Candidatus Woesearchaeota archaeon]